MKPHLKFSVGRAAVKVFPWAKRGGLAGMVLAGMALLSSVERTGVIFGLGHPKNSWERRVKENSFVPSPDTDSRVFC